MAINPNTDFTVGAVLTAAQQNRLPRGIMAFATLGTNGGLTTVVGDIGVSLSFTAVANRYYKYTFVAYASNSTAAGTLETYVTDSSNNIKGQINLYVPGGGSYTYQLLTYISTESAGTVTRKIRAKCGAGTGTIYSPLDFWVEDIGPA